MTSQTLATGSLSGFAPAQPSLPTRNTPTRGFLRILMDAVLESRRHQAEREIGHLIERSGGKFTDDIERRIEARFVERSTF